jgi:hypothetical protein
MLRQSNWISVTVSALAPLRSERELAMAAESPPILIRNSTQAWVLVRACCSGLNCRQCARRLNSIDQQHSYLAYLQVTPNRFAD